MLDADVDNDSEAETILRQAEEKFAGNPGQVMFLVKGMGENESSKFMRFGTMPWLSSNITYIPVVASPVFVIYFLIRRIVLFRETAVGKAAAASGEGKSEWRGR